jgi:ring-1,2-phenylacetyl-CoA epoxidase subunit PaaB
MPRSGPGAARPPESSAPRDVGAGGSDKRLIAMKEWPLWEVFIRSKHGLAHKHVGSIHAADAKMAIENARDIYTRRNEGASIWVARSSDIVSSAPGEKDILFDPSEDKVYRHPTFYEVPDEIENM